MRQLLFCLLLLSGFTLPHPAIAQPPPPPTEYMVQPGDTLSSIARTFGLSVAELAVLNGINDPNRLAVGQQLVVTAAPEAPLGPPFVDIRLEPQNAVQGRTQRLTVTLEPGASLTEVTYLGRSLPVAQDSGTFTALLPTPVLHTAGAGTLTLSAGDATHTQRVRILEGNYARENITLSAETSTLLAPEIVNREHALLEATCATFTPTAQWQGAFRHPVAPPETTSVFGTLRSYNGGPYTGFHRGLDYRGAVGTPVMAAADGVVTLSDDLELYGGTIVLDHGLGVCTAYMHLSERALSVGNAVAAGERLGAVGATGLATGPHLHWEVRVMGVPVQPTQWLGPW